MTQQTPLILLACSKAKLDRPAPAAELYQGGIFKKGLEYARLIGATAYILSAKYGWIALTDVIPPYDVVFKKPYKGGVWPPGWGYYVGGKNYFHYAPADRFRPLCPNRTSMGHWLQGLTELIETERARRGISHLEMTK